MTEEEAKVVARTLSRADNGCPTCITKLVDYINKRSELLGWCFVYPEDKDEVEVVRYERT